MSTRALVAVIAFAAVACGPTGSASETSTSSAEVTITTSQPVTTTTGAGSSTTSSPTTTSTVPTVPGTLVEISAGEVAGPDIVEVDLGDAVDFWVLSDIDDQIHVHGYDLYFDLEAGVPLNLTFAADIPGLFEVEVHTGNTHLLDIEVQG